MARNSPLKYRPDIDGLRAIAVLLVVVFHASPYHVEGGFIGVDVFFVISGYLISGIVLRGIAEGKFSFGDFYSRRIKRIFPALLIVIPITCIIGLFIMFADEYARLGEHVIAASVFVLNFVLWGEAGYFDYSAELKPLLHLWSLSIEEQFYLVWPALLLFATRFRWNIFIVILIIAVVSFLSNVALIERHAVAAFYMPFARAWELMLGSLLASVEFTPASAAGRRLLRWINEPGPGGSPNYSREIASFAGIAMIAVAAILLNGGKAFPGWWALLPTVGTVLIILAGMGAWLNRQVLASRPFVLVGLISYPLYLWHWPLLSFTWLNANGDPPRLVRMTAVVLAFVLAWLTYVILERPIRRSRTARPAVVLAAASTLLIFFGVYVDWEGGFAFRSINAQRLTISDVDARLTAEFRDRQIPCFAKGSDLDRSFSCFQSSKTAPKVALLGDSHSRALFPGLVNALPKMGIMHLSACAFPSLGLTINHPPSMYCEPNADLKKLQFLASDETLETVIFVFRGAMYVTGKGFGTSAKERGIVFYIKGPESQHTLSEHAERVESGISAAIDLLIRAHKNVVLVADNPELGFPISDCISGRLFATPKVPDCRVARPIVDARRKEYLAVIDQLKAEHPQLAVFDTMAMLCDDKFCYGGKDHHFYYADGDHLGMYGSNLVGAKLADFLLEKGLVK